MLSPMSVKRTLLEILLAGALLGSSGCNRTDHSQYDYHGTIDNNIVTFYERKYMGNRDENILIVTEPDSTTTEYVDDIGDDLKIEYSNTSKHDQITRHSPNGETQKKFDYYLRRIKETKMGKPEKN